MDYESFPVGTVIDDNQYYDDIPGHYYLELLGDTWSISERFTPFRTLYWSAHGATRADSYINVNNDCMSTDGGVTWNAKNVTGDDYHIHNIRPVNFGGLTRLVGIRGGAISISSNWGRTWDENAIPIPEGTVLADVNIDYSGTVHVVCGKQGVTRALHVDCYWDAFYSLTYINSPDLGATWLAPVTLYSKDTIDQDSVYYNSYILRYTYSYDGSEGTIHFGPATYWPENDLAFTVVGRGNKIYIMVMESPVTGHGPINGEGLYNEFHFLYDKGPGNSPRFEWRRIKHPTFVSAMFFFAHWYTSEDCGLTWTQYPINALEKRPTGTMYSLDGWAYWAHSTPWAGFVVDGRPCMAFKGRVMSDIDSNNFTHCTPGVLPHTATVLGAANHWANHYPDPTYQNGIGIMAALGDHEYPEARQIAGDFNYSPMGVDTSPDGLRATFVAIQNEKDVYSMKKDYAGEGNLLAMLDLDMELMFSLPNTPVVPSALVSYTVPLLMGGNYSFWW